MTRPVELTRVFGLTLASEITLPELARAPDDSEPDVSIRTGDVPARESERSGLNVYPDGILLKIEEVGRYWMREGREMIVEPAPGASERNVRLYLLGSAFAAILHQRRLLPLHANAVVIDGKAVAFMGHPGAGKSTLAAWFHDQGHLVLADDVCVVTGGAERMPIAQPGIPRLRLWREALENSGRDPGGYERSFDDMDKFTVQMDLRVPPGPAPLSHVYLLQQAVEPAIERVEGAAAVDVLVGNTYRGAYIPLMGQTQRHLFACVELARQVPVFSAGRRWGFDNFDTEASGLLAHARELIGRSSAR